ESSAGRPSIGTHLLHQGSQHGSDSLATRWRQVVFRRVMEVTERAFERLVRDHQDRIFALGLALTGNRHDAEEVAQDTFLRAYRALVTYAPERVRDLKQKAWLHQIAVDGVRNRVRGNRPRLVALNGSEPDARTAPEEAVMRLGVSAAMRSKSSAEFEQWFREDIGRRLVQADPPAGLAARIEDQLQGKRRMQFDLRGLTPFSQAVLRKTLEIPRGQVRPY